MQETVEIFTVEQNTGMGNEQIVGRKIGKSFYLTKRCKSRMPIISKLSRWDMFSNEMV